MLYHHALCNLDLAELYLELNLSSEAAELAQQGYEGFRKLGMGYESAKCLAFSAMAASQQGHGFEGTQALFAGARNVRQREEPAWPSLIDLYRALVFFNEGRLFEARRQCNQALESLRALKLANKSVLAQLLLARIAFRTGDSDEAVKHASAALEAVPSWIRRFLPIRRISFWGMCTRRRGTGEKAYASYQNAREALEKLRGNLRGEELKIAFIKNRLEVYENLVELCLASSGLPGNRRGIHLRGAGKISQSDGFVRQSRPGVR